MKYHADLLGTRTHKYTSKPPEQYTVTADSAVGLERIINTQPRGTILLRRWTDKETT